MLQRSTQVGEFYRMRAPAVPPKEDNTFMYDIIIYDEEQDKHQHIRFLDAMEAALPADVVTAFNNKGVSPFGEGVTIDAVKTAVQAGTYIKAEIVVARPFIEHLMMSAVMTVSGRDTGATLFGPADMQISANTSVKTIEGHVRSCRLKPPNPPVALYSRFAAFLAVHLPHQVRHHQAAERARAPRHHVLGCVLCSWCLKCIASC